MSLIQIPAQEKKKRQKKFCKISSKDESVSQYGKVIELPIQYSKPMLDLFTRKLKQSSSLKKIKLKPAVELPAQSPPKHEPVKNFYLDLESKNQAASTTMTSSQFRASLKARVKHSLKG